MSTIVSAYQELYFNDLQNATNYLTYFEENESDRWLVLVYKMALSWKER